MRRALICSLAALAALPAAPAVANHVTADLHVSAQLGERLSDSSWVVIVNWSINCSGPAPGNALYFGDLSLDDTGTGESTYLGGTTAASGSTKQPVSRRAEPRRMAPRMKSSCGDSGALPHGSDTVEVRGNIVSVPAKGDENGDGVPDGGSGGGLPGGDGAQGRRDFPDRRFGGPRDPLRRGGCARVRLGTSRSNNLLGTAGADLIFGLGGNDLIVGRGDDDCLIGGSGSDRLYGNSGYDRLTGGSGADILVGGRGVNRYDAGAGTDFVNARNRRAELVSCGSGRDRARVDRSDRVRSCERLSRR